MGKAVVRITTPGIGRKSCIMMLLCPRIKQRGCLSDAPAVGGGPIWSSFEAQTAAASHDPGEGDAALPGEGNALFPANATLLVCLWTRGSRCLYGLSKAIGQS